MTDKVRLLYYFLLGAFGGATGWILNAIVFYDKSNNLLAWTTLIVSGAIIGGSIGLALTLYEWLSTGSIVRLLTFGLKGLLIGMVAGSLAMPLTQTIYSALLKSSAGATESSAKRFFAGFLCWLLFGSIIGSIEGFYKGTQMWKGWLGGLIGAMISGTLYEINRPATTAMDDLFSLIWQGLGMALIGGSIGFAIALISTVMRKAWLVILDGKAKDREIDVTKYVDRNLGKRKHGIIGSDQYAANVYLPGDKSTLPRHALLSYTEEAPTLTASEEAIKLKAITTVGGRSITKSPLVDGDRIKIGQTNLIYHQK
jgi:hypothetical protein